MTRAFSLRALIVAAILYSCFLIALPQHALAFGTAADAMCAACTMTPGPNDPRPFCPTVPCHDPGSNVTGMCAMPLKCQAMNAPGLGGGNSLDQGLSQLGSILGQLMSKLMSGGGSGSGSGSGSGGAPVNTTPGCTAQPTSDMSIYQSNPTCYYYVPPVSASLGANTTGTGTGGGTSISDQLSSLFNPGASTDTNTNTNSNISNSLSQLVGGETPTAGTTTSVNVSPNVSPSVSSSTNPNPNPNPNVNVSVSSSTSVSVSVSSSTSPSPSVVIVPSNSANLLPGIRGDIQVFGTGATILGGQRDANSNSETSGFFGVNTLGGNPGTGIVASLCQSRPWANGLFSKLVPATFFDGLCSSRGYQVGTPQPVTTTPQIVVSQTAVKPVQRPTPTTKTVATTTPAVEPKVDIWAVPAKVNLGSRTSIFWNTQGVTQCTETSPDGSFSQTSLSGGASTVPITTATTFTISCLAPNGAHVTDYVTVNLNI